MDDAVEVIDYILDGVSNIIDTNDEDVLDDVYDLIGNAEVDKTITCKHTNTII